MIEFMFAEFLDGFASYVTAYGDAIAHTVSLCQEAFLNTYSPEEQTSYGMHIRNVSPVFTESIVSSVNDHMASINNVDISILGGTNMDMSILGPGHNN